MATPPLRGSPPWDTYRPSQRPRLGRRYLMVAQDPAVIVQKISDTYSNETRGVHVNAYATEYETRNQVWFTVAVELWTEAISSELDALDQALKSIEEVAAEVRMLARSVYSAVRALGPDYSRRVDETRTHPLEAEWLDGPMFGDSVSSDQVGFFLSAMADSEPFASAAYESGRLRVGPESGSIAATIRAARRLEELERTNRRLRRQVQQGRSRGSPWYILALAPLVLMLLAWAIPLGWVEAALFLGAFLALLAAAALANRRPTVSRGVLVAAVSVFFLDAFGSAFAFSSLIEPDSLAKGGITQLGQAYLVSTGLGVGAGVVAGEISGAAKVIANIQILLFATFVGGLVVAAARVILRMDGRMETLRDGL